MKNKQSQPWYIDNNFEIILSNENPNHPGGMHTNGPATFWFREVGEEEWHMTYRSNEVYTMDLQKLMMAGLNRSSLRAILFAGGRF